MDMRGHGRTNRAFTGIPTFLRSNLCMDHTAVNADFAVFGIPLDEGSPYMRGARFAPRTITRALHALCPHGLLRYRVTAAIFTARDRNGPNSGRG
ncbi:arginase family protein [Alcaligenes endophyticus]|uniref:arginase family protein n=2 Tax=Alcaligenes endophyticus TaxID=1929088 RepID=UPI00361B2F83